MKIAFLGDLHGRLDDPPPGADVAVICGDVCPDGADWEVRRWVSERLRPWLDSQAVPVVAVPGNHDLPFFRDPGLAKPLRWQYLADCGAEVRGVRFWGYPWVPAPISGGFGRAERETIPSALAVPWGRVDVLVTHALPYGFGDLTNHSACKEPCNRGYFLLKYAIASHGWEGVVAGGHCHDSRGQWWWKGCRLVNATSGWNGSEGGCGSPSPKPHDWMVIDHSPGDPPFTVGGTYRYVRSGLGERILRLEHDGLISQGAARMERQWRLDDSLRLVISGDSENTMTLERRDDGTWSGAWHSHEKCDVLLEPVDP